MDIRVNNKNEIDYFGAIVVCSGRSIAATFVQKQTDSQFGHSAFILDKVVYKNNEFLYPGNKRYVIEITKYFTANKDGLFVHELEDFITKYNGDVFINILNIKINEKEKKNLLKYINSLLKKGVGYEKNLGELSKMTRGPLPICHQNLEYYACSEFVADLLGNLKLLPNDIAYNSYLPKHFGCDKKSQMQIEDFKKKAKKLYGVEYDSYYGQIIEKPFKYINVLTLKK